MKTQTVLASEVTVGLKVTQESVRVTHVRCGAAASDGEEGEEEEGKAAAS